MSTLSMHCKEKENNGKQYSKIKSEVSGILMEEKKNFLNRWSSGYLYAEKK